MSCGMMGHYFWHYSLEPLVFRIEGMKLTSLKESVSALSYSTFVDYLPNYSDNPHYSQD